MMCKTTEMLLLLVPVLLSSTGSLLSVQSSKVNKDTPFSCVWNSPTVQCEQYNLTFNLTEFQIIQNCNDSFIGEKITIFYGPGEFPKIDRTTGEHTNGGLPQLGNLTLHLEKLAEDVNKEIPDKDFQGLAVLDFEQWRPLYKHNFDALNIYQKASEDLVKKQHPDWTNKTQIKEEAERQFNTAARQFFESTLKAVRTSRPGGRWGYYGFPRCYGKHGNYCAPGSQEDNDALDWLWTASTALYPRIYLAEDTDQTDKIFFLVATAHEAVRLSNKYPPGQLLVYPYSRHTYDDKPGHYFSDDDAYLSHATTSLLGGDGLVIWGSTKSMESQSLCSTLHKYVYNDFGLTTKDFIDWTLACSLLECLGHGQCTAQYIPSELSFLSETQQKGWTDYFLKLLTLVKEGKMLDDDFLSCKCYPGWKGPHCTEPNLI